MSVKWILILRLLMAALFLQVFYSNIPHFPSTHIEQVEIKSKEETKSSRELFKEDLKVRAKLLKHVCKENSKTLRWREKDLLTHMQNKDLWDMVKRIIYCPIAKVASTSWQLNFLEMVGIEKKMIRKGFWIIPKEDMASKKKSYETWSGVQGGMGIREQARYLYSPPQTDNITLLKSFFGENEGFMIVRHPFVRLVSAYEDKMLNPHPFPYKHHHRIQEKIKKRRTNKEAKITFPAELLNSKKYKTNLLKNRISLEQLASQPSFPEFVDWFISDRDGKEDDHNSWKHDMTWTPFYTVCPVCDLDYTVLKLDSERDEFNLYIEQMGLPLNQSTAEHAVGGKRKSVEKVNMYFKKLTEFQIDSLVNIYKYDFQLFGYDFKRFYDLK